MLRLGMGREEYGGSMYGYEVPAGQVARVLKFRPGLVTMELACRAGKSNLPRAASRSSIGPGARCPPSEPTHIDSPSARDDDHGRVKIHYIYPYTLES